VTNSKPLRGQVYRVALGSIGLEPYVIVSNNRRNRLLDSALAMRVTTTDKSHIPTAVPLNSDDPVVGYVLADDIVEIYDGELEAGTCLGSLSPHTILNINTALMQALGIP
jgi:mRNA interferase MazF